MNKKILSAALGAVIVTGSAQAAIIEDSFLNDYRKTEINQTGTLSKFDDSLGELNSVTLNLVGGSISEALLTNNASGTETFSFDSELNFFFDLSSVNVTPPSPAFTTVLASTGGFIGLDAGDSITLGPNTEDSFLALVFSDAATLSNFIGNGQFNVKCNTLSGSNFVGGGGNISNDQTTTARCGADISYDYTTTSVPEPATLALLGMGLTAFGFSRRKAK